MRVNHQSPASRHMTPLTALMLTTVLVLFVVVTSPGDAAPAQRLTGHVGPPAASSSNGRRPAARPAGSAAQQQPPPGGTPHNYTIARPGSCRDDAVYADCFLCGKIADDPRIYRDCCFAVEDIVSFCLRLLS